MQFLDFAAANSPDFPRHFKFSDYGNVQFDFEAELRRQEQAIKRESEEKAERLKREAKQQSQREIEERRRTRIKVAIRLGAITACILIFIALIFSALFKKVELHQPLNQSKIVALSDPKDLVELLRSSEFASQFSELVSLANQRLEAASKKETEALTKQKNIIATHQSQVSAVSTCSVRELVQNYATMAPEKFSELTNSLNSLELLEKIVTSYAPPAQNNEPAPRTFLPAKQVSQLGRALGMRMSESDALRWKYNLPSRAEIESEQRHKKQLKNAIN